LNPAPTLLFFVTEDWYFCAHWLHFAVAAKRAGYRVTVLTRVHEHRRSILDAGLELIPIELSRHGLNPVQDLTLVRRLLRVYRELRPDLVHQVAMKPILYGSLAARLSGARGIVNLAAGLGVVFAGRGPAAHLLRPLLRAGFHLIARTCPSRFVFQNPDDARRLFARGEHDPRVKIIRGVGVDPDLFTPSPEPDGTPLVVLPARLIWDKGIREFVEAAGRVRAGGVNARFALVGEPDPSHPGSVPRAQLEAWQQDGRVEWWGHCSDMPTVYARCNICCLPTKYGEGLPTVLLEAAACGRALVATDAPGCREVVHHGDNGLLVPVGDAQALAESLARLLGDASLRHAMGRRGRQRVEAHFTRAKVEQETVTLYRELVPPAEPP
jgi:glycosyltransferase involved in cell wall biosynthesis